MTETPVLEVKGLKTYFYLDDEKVAKAVDGVDIVIRRGETVALVGESGSGKSITSLSIMRLVDKPGRIEAGEILYQGKDLAKLSEKEMTRVRGNDIAMIFQEPMTALNPVFTIGNQITEVLRKHMKLSKKEAFERGVELLKMVGFLGQGKRCMNTPINYRGGCVSGP